MIIASLKQPGQVAACHPSMPRLLDFLASHDLMSLPEGRIEVDGDNIYINSSIVDGRRANEMPLEFHRGYIDVHLLLEGEETIGWTPLCDTCRWTTEYDPEKDIIFAADTHSTYITLRPGQMAVMFPEDGHAPIIGNGKIHKLICKIKV